MQAINFIKFCKQELLKDGNFIKKNIFIYIRGIIIGILMSETNFITVKLANRKTSIKMEKGCSFENNGAIYRLDDKGSLNIFDKAKQTWTAGDAIKINDYQLQTLKAVANNYIEKKKGKPLGDIVLSKTDIDMALKQHKEGGLMYDLPQYLGDTYEVKAANRYSAHNAISAYVSNDNEKTSGMLVFKHGSQADAVRLSGIVEKVKTALVNKLFGKSKQTTQEVTQEKVESKKTKKTTSATTVQKTQEVKTEVAEKVDTPKKTTNTKKSAKRNSIESMPEFYQISLKTVAKNLKMSMYALKKEIAKVAKKTGYSEYFIAHVIATEKYDSKPDKKKDGAITVGFGHTNLIDKNITTKTKVTPQKAFIWLANDIMQMEKVVKKLKINSKTGKTYGDYFDKLPLSMREGLIDVAFNRDASKLETDPEYNSLRINIEKGYYPAAAVRIRQTFPYTLEQAKKHRFTRGLMKRNVYRFLLAVRDFNSSEIASAKRRFEADKYYYNTVELLKAKNQKTEIKLLNEAWNEIK